MSRLRLFLILFSVCGFAPMFAQERELYWDRLAVKAHLGEDGRLRVEETHSMVFTGDWNGGERTFNLRPRQELSFEGMSRIDPQTGAAVPMSQGSLDEVGNWDWAEDHVLRWRARSPADPPFNEATVKYILRYALTNILVREDDQFVLDHDFAFPEREGPINHFNLKLTLDPAWVTSGELQKTWTVDAMPPGKSFVLRVPLRYRGSGVPIAHDGPGDEVRMMLYSLGIIPLLLLGYGLMREKMLGRLDPPEKEISRAWLAQNVLRERPEVIGAMWDEDVGESEVAATLARMVGEGRLQSKVKGDEMDLTILRRDDLDDYEQALIDGLFFAGDHTSTSKIKAHYEDRGFNPAESMAAGLKTLVNERLPKGEPVKPSHWVSTLLFLAALAALIWTTWNRADLLVESAVIFFGSLFAAGLAAIAPNAWRIRKLRGVPTALLAMIPAAIVAGAVGYVVWRSAFTGSPEWPVDMQLAMTLLALWIFATAVHGLRSRESRESIAFIKMLSAAREYFRRELGQERPSLEDSWYPYLLAFGLGGDVEQWFKSFPGRTTSRDDGWRSSSSGSSSSSQSGSSSPAPWTGGGGAFGGAGASGTWALAATGMAAGVAAPSSSSGGSSSSSSSGGSSGGGGGGGW